MMAGLISVRVEDGAIVIRRDGRSIVSGADATSAVTSAHAQRIADPLRLLADEAITLDVPSGVRRVLLTELQPAKP
jgi:hypothetical protein